MRKLAFLLLLSASPAMAYERMTTDGYLSEDGGYHMVTRFDDGMDAPRYVFDAGTNWQAAPNPCGPGRFHVIAGRTVGEAECIGGLSNAEESN